MSEWVDFNLKQNVKVKLNDLGVQIYLDHYKHFHDLIGATDSQRTPRVDEDGFTTFQMWSFVIIFGGHLSTGVISPFELDAQIEVCDDRKTPQKPITPVVESLISKSRWTRVP